MYNPRSLLLFAALLTSPVSHAKRTTVTWLGLDYSLVSLVGTQDFHQPDKIFPYYAHAWNTLLLQEQIDNLEKKLRARVIPRAQAALEERHESLNANERLVRNDMVWHTEPRLDEATVRQHVKNYEPGPSGIGLVFVVEQLNKTSRKGCHWATFVDTESLEVLRMRRICGNARGFGFRNYWFGTVKDAIKQLKKAPKP